MNYFGTTSPNYLAKDDKREFFDIEKGLPILSVGWDDWSKQRAKRFLDFFLSNFPIPPMAKRELCETQEQYDNYVLNYQQFSNPYYKWAEQCYLYILKGFRVGIPYLKNTEKMENGFNVMKPNLPPLRYRHWEDLEIEGSNFFFGTVKLLTGIRKILGYNASHDTCNDYFDFVVRGEGKDPTLWKNVMETSNIVSFSKPVQILNADQSPTCNAPLLLQKSFSGEKVDEIYKLWGTKSEIGVNFPTMWYKRGENLYGDGSKTDPYFAIQGFPRFHEDFQNNKIRVNLKQTSEYDKPGDDLLRDVHDFFIKSVYPNWQALKIRNFYMNKESIIKVWLWYNEESRWNRMRRWLLDNCPEMLFYYYTEWSQKNASHNTDYLQAMGSFIYLYVAFWMVTPSNGLDFVQWHNQMKKPEKTKEEGTIGEVHPDRDALSLAVKQPDGSYRWEIAEKDIRYIPPSYGDKYKVPRLQSLYSKKMFDLRELWKNSYVGFFTKDEWIDKVPNYPNISDTFTEDFTDPLKVNDEIYIEHGFNFIKQYPLPSPIMPPRGEGNPNYHTWDKACNVQWDFYMIWVAANINAQGKPGYIKPNSIEILNYNDNGRPVYNQCPNTGILPPIKVGETVTKIGHILTFGLSTIWGDSWWNDITNFLKNTFDFVIEKLYQIAKYIKENLPEIGIGLLGIGAIALGGYALFQYVGEESRQYAKG